MMKKIILILLLNFQLFMLGTVLAQSPIGDNTHTEVYTFIQNELINSKSWSKVEVTKLREQEIRHKNNNDLKPHIADMHEGELSSLLKILCQVHSSCEQITLYQKEGVGIATSGLKKPITFNTPRNIDFTMGILSAEIMQTPKGYALQAKNNLHYNECLFGIYKNNEENYAYLATKNKKPTDKLIGYMSYILHDNSKKHD